MRSEAQKRAERKYAAKRIKPLTIKFYDGSGRFAKRIDALKAEHGLRGRADVIRMLLKNYPMPSVGL